MLELDFTAKGYVIMGLIWGVAGVYGALLARKKRRNPILWGFLCLAAPIALFAIGGMRAPGEKLPPRLQQMVDEERAERAMRQQQKKQP